jgi:hypothetical protein
MLPAVDLDDSTPQTSRKLERRGGKEAVRRQEIDAALGVTAWGYCSGQVCPENAKQPHVGRYLLCLDF